MWNWMNKKQPAKDLIVNVVTKEKKPKFTLYRIPPPSPDQESMIAKVLKKAWANYRLWELDGEAEPNPMACFNWMRPCYWYTQGACKRY
jgi:hypothetical protein